MLHNLKSFVNYKTNLFDRCCILLIFKFSLELDPNSMESMSSSNNDNLVLFGAVGAAVVVLLTAILVVVCFSCRRNRRNHSRENARDIGEFPNPAYEGDVKRNMQRPHVINTENHYDQPSVYAQLDSTTRVALDANYQSLHLDGGIYEDVDE